MNKKIKRLFYRGVILLVGGYLPIAPAVQHGGVSLTPTRLIFQASDTAQSLTIKNQDEKTYLIQAGSQISPDNIQPAPFIVTPPLFRLEPGSKNSLRVLRSGNTVLPDDRESVFYLSALAIPAGEIEEAQSKNGIQLSMGFRFYIKLLYRPAGLAMTAEEAGCRLRLKQRGNNVQVVNPTPYALTLATLAFDERAIDLDRWPAMIAPFTQQDYPAPQRVVKGQWQVVTDYGGISTFCRQAMAQD
ncbi:molecular chaperone [Serratia sp. NPDC078593]|uniref:fimbrial biogenesis chaperone n=1 Tax=unclassified Serratia (in: enterobacteria) TaxID=2647522 RepID=UPI0037D70590